MIQIENIGNEPRQRFTLEFGGFDVELLIRYYDQLQFWDIDIDCNGVVKKGTKLISNARIVLDERLPFDLMAIDNSNQYRDAYDINDFTSGRLSLYIMDSDDLNYLKKAIYDER